MLLQLMNLDLGQNNLMGNIPEAWSTLISVSLCCQALHLLIDVAAPVSAL